jgi:hypothetical protein
MPSIPQGFLNFKELISMSESVTLLVARLYAEAAEAVKSLASLSASIPELISILGDINSEARL